MIISRYDQRRWFDLPPPLSALSSCSASRKSSYQLLWDLRSQIRCYFSFLNAKQRLAVGITTHCCHGGTSKLFKCEKERIKQSFQLHSVQSRENNCPNLQILNQQNDKQKSRKSQMYNRSSATFCKDKQVQKMDVQSQIIHNPCMFTETCLTSLTLLTENDFNVSAAQSPDFNLTGS